MRIGTFFLNNQTESFQFEAGMQGVTQLFDEDLDEIIAQSFDKLDITDENSLTVKYIRQGLLVNSKSHVNKNQKQQNKALLEYVYNMRSAKTFGKQEFGQFIREQLQQEPETGQVRQSVMMLNQYEQAAGRSNERYHESGGKRSSDKRASRDSNQGKNVKFNTPGH